MPCNKIDKPLVVKRFLGNFMTSLKTCVQNNHVYTRNEISKLSLSCDE